MIKFERKVARSAQITSTPPATLTLNKDQREKSRLKVTLDDGREGGLFFAKGTTFQDGDLIICTNDETLVEVKAASETVSTVISDNPLELAKACYHLGNRHIALQIESNFLRYQHDHVLDEMVRGFGLTVTVEEAPFEPEAGAYSGGGHHHHSHENDHSPEHSHEHNHSHGQKHEHHHD